MGLTIFPGHKHRIVSSTAFKVAYTELASSENTQYLPKYLKSSPSKKMIKTFLSTCHTHASLTAHHGFMDLAFLLG